MKTNGMAFDWTVGLSRLPVANLKHQSQKRATQEALQSMERKAIRIDLSGQGLGDEDAIALAGALQSNNTNLLELDLSNNAIGDEGANALGNALKANGTLLKLILDCNSIGPEGARGLSQGLKVNASLRFLHLGRNSIGPKGANGLAEMLQMNASLQELHVNCSLIGMEGAQSLAEALQMNASVHELDLKNNSIRSVAEQAVEDAKQRLKAPIARGWFSQPPTVSRAICLLHLVTHREPIDADSVATFAARALRGANGYSAIPLIQALLSTTNCNDSSSRGPDVMPVHALVSTGLRKTVESLLEHSSTDAVGNRCSQLLERLGADYHSYLSS